MHISFDCSCGYKLMIDNLHRGDTINCPACGEPMVANSPACGETENHTQHSVATNSGDTPGTEKKLAERIDHSKTAKGSKVGCAVLALLVCSLGAYIGIQAWSNMSLASRRNESRSNL
jgi:hypothetical protein